MLALLALVVGAVNKKLSQEVSKESFLVIRIILLSSPFYQSRISQQKRDKKKRKKKKNAGLKNNNIIPRKGKRNLKRNACSQKRWGRFLINITTFSIPSLPTDKERESESTAGGGHSSGRKRPR